MVSIITCSINPKKLDELRKNIGETIGETPYEMIAIDNRKNPKSIASVYNDGATNAQYPYLLFIHEDAGFITKNWVPKIVDKLKERDCGVIGFGGSRGMLNGPSGWAIKPDWNIYNLIENGNHLSLNIEPDTPAFVEVVAIDGFAMFARKDVWEKYPFDESAITGFHCYDVDFSLGIGGEYKNYVCTDVLLYHNSKGNFDEKWARATLDLYKTKWNKILPRYADGIKLSAREEKNLEERIYWRLLKIMRKFNIEDKEIFDKFKKYPLTSKHLQHLFRIYIKI